MEDRIEELVAFIQERYLWQFHSRSWDREANINGIMDQAIDLLSNKPLALETWTEKCYYADAKFFVDETKMKFPWLQDMEEDQQAAVLEGVKARLTEITVTKSKNSELHHQNY